MADHHIRSLVVAALAVAALTVARAPIARGAPIVTYQPPVDAPIAVPFVAPSHPYGPGHRGIEYATEAGITVHAAADGAVSFAGVVAGAGYVTLVHADGLRTTVGSVVAIVVATGQVVRAGEALGTTEGPLLFTVRRGDEYLDPATILGRGGPPQVHLIPDHPPDHAVESLPAALPAPALEQLRAEMPSMLGVFGFG